MRFFAGAAFGKSVTFVMCLDLPDHHRPRLGQSQNGTRQIRVGLPSLYTCVPCGLFHSFQHIAQGPLARLQKPTRHVSSGLPGWVIRHYGVLFDWGVQVVQNKKRPRGSPVAAVPPVLSCLKVYSRPFAKSRVKLLIELKNTVRSSYQNVNVKAYWFARSASILRHSATLALCSASVTANACPPVPSATKKM